jgi:hypothetical protein
MGAAISGSVEIQVHAQAITARDLGNVSYPLDIIKRYLYTDGSGALKANKMFDDTRTVSASSSETLDLSGSLVDADGVTLAFTKIKAIVIIASPDNTNDVVVGNGSNPVVGGPFGADGTQEITIHPGDCFAMFSNSANGLFAVTDSTADGLKVANSSSGTGVDYSIILIGE